MNKRVDPTKLAHAKEVGGQCPAAAIAQRIDHAVHLADQLSEQCGANSLEALNIMTREIEVSDLLDNLGGQLDWVTASTAEGLHAQLMQLSHAFSESSDPDVGEPARRRIGRLLHRMAVGLESVGNIPAARRLKSPFWLEKPLDLPDFMEAP